MAARFESGGCVLMHSVSGREPHCAGFDTFGEIHSMLRAFSSSGGHIEIMIAHLYADKNFQAVLNALPVPLAIHDNLGNMTFLNKVFEAAFGYTTADIPTLDAWWPTAYPDPDYRKRLANIWQQYLEVAKRTGSPFTPMEADVRCKDGSIRTISCSAAPLGEAPAECHLAILYDITDQKRIEN